jgi:hypothetical protein
MLVSVKLRNDPRLITREESHVLAKAITKVFRTGGNLLKERGRQAIAAGGFGGKWQSAWKVNTYPKSGASLSPKIFAVHQIRYAGEFQDPDTIVGHPLLWLPIEKNLPGGGHWTPKKYRKQIGPLRGGRRGAGRPILFGQVAVGRGGKVLKRKPRAGATVHKVWLPVFVGVRAVHDPKRFDLVAVAERVAADIGQAISKVIS